MPYSHAVGVAIICLENYLDDEIPIGLVKDGKDTEFRVFLDAIRESVQHLAFAETFLGIGQAPGGFSRFRKNLAVIAGNEIIFEYFAGVHALDTLYRLEKTKERILDVIGCLPATKPPARS